MGKNLLLSLLVLTLFFISNVSALNTNIKSSYGSQETMIIKIGGNIAEAIRLDQVSFKRNNIFMPIEYDVKRIGDSWYIWAIAPEQKGKYTFILNDIKTIQSGSTLKKENYQTYFDVVSNLTGYNINPGFIITDRAFSIWANVLDDQEKEIVAGFDNNQIILLESGTNRIDFSIARLNHTGFYTLTVGKYAVPVYVTVSGSTAITESPTQNSVVNTSGNNNVVNTTPNTVVNNTSGNNVVNTTPNTVVNVVNTTPNTVVNNTSGNNVVNTTPNTVVNVSGNNNVVVNDSLTNNTVTTVILANGTTVIVNSTGDSESVSSTSYDVDVEPYYIQRLLFSSAKSSTYSFTLSNPSNITYKNLKITFNKSLFDIEPDDTITLKANENYSFVITLGYFAGKEIKERIFINATNVSIEIPFFVKYTQNATDVAVFYGESGKNMSANASRKTTYLCSELGGVVCSTSRICKGEGLQSKEGTCCLGICTQSASSKNKSWIGWIIAFVILGALWFFYYKYKNVGSKKVDIAEMTLPGPSALSGATDTP